MSAPEDPRPPLPPFDAETATRKVRMAEDAWNTREPARVAKAYTPDSTWRNRTEFITGREAIEAFLIRKWSRELEYRLVKELWAFHANRIASINDLPIAESERRFRWPAGRRPDDHPGLTALGL